MIETLRESRQEHTELTENPGVGLPLLCRSLGVELHVWCPDFLVVCVLKRLDHLFLEARRGLLFASMNGLGNDFDSFFIFRRRISGLFVTNLLLFELS